MNTITAIKIVMIGVVVCMRSTIIVERTYRNENKFYVNTSVLIRLLCRRSSCLWHDLSSAVTTSSVQCFRGLKDFSLFRVWLNGSIRQYGNPLGFVFQINKIYNRNVLDWNPGFNPGTCQKWTKSSQASETFWLRGISLEPPKSAPNRAIVRPFELNPFPGWLFEFVLPWLAASKGRF